VINSRCYRVTDHVRRLSIQLERQQRDPRDPDVYPDQREAVRASVREERLRDLERTWQERQLSAFDWLVKKWHEWDPDLYKYLSDEPRLRAVHILRKEGQL
jgi:hypothetical protein